LNDRFFSVKHDNVITKLNSIQAGVPQGSMLGPIFYLLYTADLPTQIDVTLDDTFADDIAVLTVHQNSVIASEMLQDSLNSTDK